MTTGSNYGGVRPNAGRKVMTAEEKQSILEVRQAAMVTVVTHDLIFPALCQAFRAEPGRWKERYLSVSLSKLDIKRAYGVIGLSIWQRYFKQDKIGGRDKKGNGYKTRWCLHLGSYDIAKLLVESLGHSLKDLPNPGFPPHAMQSRLDALDAKKVERQAKVLAKVVDVTTARKRISSITQD